MSIINPVATLVCALALAWPASARDDAFGPVRKAVRDRTKQELRWEQDQAAREQSLARARALLKHPVTIASAVQIALLNNRELQATFEEIGLSLADVREARLIGNPEADLEIRFPDRPPTAAAYEWSIAQGFLDLLMIPLRSRVARAQLAAAQLRVADEVIKLVSEVKIAVYELQADDALLARLRTELEAHAASLQLMQKLHEAGNVPDLHLSREQVAYSRARLEIALAEGEKREDREKLNRLLGVWGRDTTWTIGGELPPVPNGEPTVTGLETLAVANRFDLAAARAQLASMIKALGLEKTFRFIGALDFGIAGEREPDKTNLIGPTFSFQLPIFNQGQARIARGEAQLRSAHRKFEQLAIEIRSMVREHRDRLISKREIARFYRDEMLPMRQRVLGETLLNYNAMITGAFELFEAKRQAVEAERNLIEVTRDYWTTRAELERAVGGDLDAKPRSDARSNSGPAKSMQKTRTR